MGMAITDKLIFSDKVLLLYEDVKRLHDWVLICALHACEFNLN